MPLRDAPPDTVPGVPAARPVPASLRSPVADTAVTDVATAADSLSAAAQACEGRPIARIEIEPKNIFDPVPPGRLAPVLRLANRLHVRTRRQTVQEQLLFRTGEPWWAARGQETKRNLRGLDFLAPMIIAPRRFGDSVVVSVVTRDVWSTRPEFNLESADGRRFGSVALTEQNFAGLGKGMSIAYRDLPGGRSRSMTYSDPSVVGTRARFRISASTGASGASDDLYFGQPFYSEEARRSVSFSWSRSTSVMGLYENAVALTTFNRRFEHSEIAWGFGRRGNGGVRRLIYYYDVLERRLGPSTMPVGTAPPEFLGGEESLRLRRFSVEGRWWRPNYIERTRINGFGLVEDFDVGPAAALRVGYAPQLIGSSQDEGYARANLDAGVVTPWGFGTLSSSASTRFQTMLLETIGQVDARWYRQTRAGETIVLAARGIAGDNVVRDFQTIVGGLSGLRAYPVAALAGRRMWRLNAEDRWLVGERFWESVTLGAVAFVDAARAWGPGASGTGWFVAAGTGVRIALPQWSLGQVMRIDVAWPVEPSRDGRHKPVLSFGSSQGF